jgi:mannose-6-phosphate isomerase-like protein (cupin superfamily)
MDISLRAAALPGAIGVTHLKVYDTPTPDGLVGGSPHVHFACTEAYAVLAGSGAVQTLSAAGFDEIPLAPGKLVWFTPGVIHRLINHDGQLEILVLMQNAGLPEAGDMVLTFPRPMLQDEQTYLSVASLAPKGNVYAASAEAARHRRDHAVGGFLELYGEFEAKGIAALDSFYSTALKLIESRISGWQTRWERGPLAAVRDTGDQLNALQNGRFDHLLEGRVYALPEPGGERKLGVCGTLSLYLPEGFA